MPYIWGEDDVAFWRKTSFSSPSLDFHHPFCQVPQFYKVPKCEILISWILMIFFIMKSL
jgi:hypothetical protein